MNQIDFSQNVATKLTVTRKYRDQNNIFALIEISNTWNNFVDYLWYMLKFSFLCCVKDAVFCIHFYDIHCDRLEKTIS